VKLLYQRLCKAQQLRSMLQLFCNCGLARNPPDLTQFAFILGRNDILRRIIDGAVFTRNSHRNVGK